MTNVATSTDGWLRTAPHRNPGALGCLHAAQTCSMSAASADATIWIGAALRLRLLRPLPRCLPGRCRAPHALAPQRSFVSRAGRLRAGWRRAHVQPTSCWTRLLKWLGLGTATRHRRRPRQKWSSSPARALAVAVTAARAQRCDDVCKSRRWLCRWRWAVQTRRWLAQTQPLARRVLSGGWRPMFIDSTAVVNGAKWRRICFGDWL
jgi:hypothetical protein